MPIGKLLIANRGEIAIRIAASATELGIQTVGIFSEDDRRSSHVEAMDEPIVLESKGAKAYLNIENIVDVAVMTECDAVHPGYGFLSESSLFADRIEQAGLIFVGPTPETLRLFGDKVAARSIAREVDVPTIRGTMSATNLEDMKSFFDALPSGSAMMIKAVSGGGGRGTRIVRTASELDSAYERCQSEALNAFGDDRLYAEELLEHARHIEVQVVGDGSGSVIHLFERECSAQRRHQKILEVAPAPNLPDSLRQQIHEATLALAAHVRYRSLGTFEFLITGEGEATSFAFIEANARLQVEHTVTEEVTGVDLVETQLQLAAGSSLGEAGLNSATVKSPIGYAIQARVNMETMTTSGEVRPSGGRITTYELPSGPGIRVDGYGYSGYRTSPSFDSLLCKVITHSRANDFGVAVKKSERALANSKIEGVDTNIDLLRSILETDEFLGSHLHTRWVDENASQLVEKAIALNPEASKASSSGGSGFAGAQIASRDPLALFEHDKSVKAQESDDTDDEEALPIGPDGSVGQPAPIQGTIVTVNVDEGTSVYAGQELVIMEAMKMEHVIAANVSGIVRQVTVEKGDVIQEGHPLVFVEEADVAESAVQGNTTLDPDYIRPDLAESYDRHSWIYDNKRPKAMERRARTGQQTARTNIEQFCDDGSFIEYGPLVLAAQRRRRTEEWLRENTPADGLVGGVGTANADLFGEEAARCVAVAYDYTVFAGTQGHKNHYKQDRLYELANRFRLPVVLFSEGGGGRPGDTDGSGGVGMDTYTFTQWSKLSARVPLVGLNSGRCFAGNTALLGCCDVIIATKDSTIAMGGPAMIEGGGLGIFTPEEVGPMSFQVPNGVVDVLVEDDRELIATAKKYLSYFQGTVSEWQAPDQRGMRHIVPENRLRMYNVREVIETLADKDSVLEIRKEFGIGIVTAFLRVEGRSFGVIANNPHHIAGAIDSDGADKAARFLQLCDAFDIPLISIMDCPGMMVGPEVEKTALVRHCCRLFNIGANLSVPMFGVIIRKAYGLGVQAMCGGSSQVPFFSVAWPTAEFAGMNIEGSVKLGYRNELADLPTAEERIALFDQMVASSYERAKAVNSATFYGVDDVIDPAETRSWIVRGMKSLPPVSLRETKKRAYIDTW